MKSIEKQKINDWFLEKRVQQDFYPIGSNASILMNFALFILIRSESESKPDQLIESKKENAFFKFWKNSIQQKFDIEAELSSSKNANLI